MTVRILVGDVRDRLREIPDESVDLVVTSPPYWGLRDYGTATWDGGDQACDHLAPMPGGFSASGLGDWDSQSAEAIAAKVERRRQQYRDVCGKCGAQRVDLQIGLEPTLGEHIDKLVAIFAEIWRVLKPSGSVFLNYGDTYATYPNGRSAEDAKAAGDDDRTFRDKPFSTYGPIYDPAGGKNGGGYRGDAKRPDAAPEGRVVAGGYLKPKDLCLVPARLAIALQERAPCWWIRSENIWAKPNPMPDSRGATRPSGNTHEKVFLLSKSGEILCWRHADGRWTWEKPAPDFIWRHRKTREVTRTPQDGDQWIRINLWQGRDFYYEPDAVAQPASSSTEQRLGRVKPGHGSKRANGGTRADRPMTAVRRAELDPSATPPGSRTHTGLTAADEERGETRFLRNYEPPPAQVWEIGSAPFADAHFATFPPELAERCILAGCPPGGVVLDPFGGAGTTGLVADRLQRNAILIELKPDYADMARERINSDAGRLFPAAEQSPAPDLQGQLFEEAGADG